MKLPNLLRISALAFVVLLVSCTSNSTTETVKKSTNYEDLTSLYKEFKKFQEHNQSDVANFAAEKMQKQYDQLTDLQKQLKSIDPDSWSVTNQIDYHLVRAEMNGLEFQHRVQKPWVKDPCFYLDQLPGLMYFPYMRLVDYENFDELKADLKQCPGILEQAKANLTNFKDIAGDLAILAIRRLDDFEKNFETKKEREAELYAQLDPEISAVRSSLNDFKSWIVANQDQMTAKAGVGKENYDWLLKNVYLFPYTWDDCRRIVEMEDSRVNTFLKFEQNRNRHLEMNKPVQSQAEYKASVAKAINDLMKFIDKEELFTVHDFIETDSYFGSWHGFENPWPEHHDYFFNFSHREPIMEEAHEMVGHHFDGLRQEHDLRPIRGQYFPYKISTGRNEGYAFALEELLMHAGFLDDRPQRGREIVYEQAAFRTVRGLSDVYMHSNDWTLEDAMEYCVANAPHGELLDNSPHLWFELETTLRGVGHHMIMIVGKVQLMALFRDRAKQLGDDFNMKEFWDEYFAAGMIPQSLIRWEMTGKDDEIKNLW